MFFKPKQKMDPKVRFQNSAFKRQLEQARNYKRTPAKIPETKFGIFLSKVGLSCWWAKILVIAVLAFLIYAIYIPNPLYIKNINITGIKTEDQTSVKAVINQYLNPKKIWPQKNLILLSQTKLAEAILKGHKKVYKVSKISKKWPNTLVLDLEARMNRYVIETPDQKAILSNDGLVTEKLPSSTATSNLIAIKILNAKEPVLDEKYLNEEFLGTLSDLYKEIPRAANVAVDHFALENQNPFDINAYVASGYKIIFDAKPDIAGTMQRLKLLLSEFSVADRQNIYYIDMRFKNKGYVCLKNTQCVKDAVIGNTDPATSTPATTTTAQELN